MMRLPSRLLGATIVGSLGAFAACSLQMPSESEVFGGSAETTTGGSSANSAGKTSSGGGGSSTTAAGSGGDTGGNAGGANGGARSGGSSAGGNANGGASTGGSGAGNFDPSRGLVAHFDFDETTGTTAVNSVDASKNASYNGACTHPVGQLGNSVQLRNSSPSAPDWIELPSGLLRGLAATTISVWMRDLSTMRAGGRLLHFSRGGDEEIYFAPDDDNPDTNARGSHLAGKHDNKSFVNLWTTSTVLTDKLWHHVAFTWSSDRIELYVDGSSVQSKSKPGALPSNLGRTTPNWLGRTLDDGELALYAELDELRVYDRALTAADIAQLYALR